MQTVPGRAQGLETDSAGKYCGSGKAGGRGRRQEPGGYCQRVCRGAVRPAGAGRQDLSE